jgi:hypothetical protein
MAMPLLYRIAAASGSTHFSSPPFRAGHSNAIFRKQGKAPLPQHVRDWLQEMVLLIDGGANVISTPLTVRQGLADWNKLTPPIGANGRGLDLTNSETESLIHGIVVRLINWKGKTDSLVRLMKQVEDWIEKNRW